VKRGGVRGAIEDALPKDRFGDHLNILSGTGQNAIGLVIAVVATFATQVLITRAFGRAVFGIVTIATQIAFVGSYFTRYGMDAAAVRLVAIQVGRGESNAVRRTASRSIAIAAGASALVAVAVFLAAGPVARALYPHSAHVVRPAIQAAALALPFAALAQVWLGATRGLKIMRYTLYLQFAGQPVFWIALMLALWPIAKTAGMSVLAYAASWMVAALGAWWGWEREARRLERGELVEGPGAAPRPGRGPTTAQWGSMLRYGTPRAPAALFSQALFWGDLFVFAHYAATKGAVGVYSAAVRAAQALVLFLTSVSLVFSPFVADLYERGDRERLDQLYKTVTRWTMAATLPVLLVLAIVPGPILKIFGGTFSSGKVALEILIVGQFTNVSVGAVGFILIMVGRTGWDLLVYASSFVLDVAVAIALAPHLGMKGAAIAQTSTLIVSNAARLYLVWRFVGIWPFDRHYARLAVPALAGAIVMGAAHVVLHRAAWPTDLGGSLVAGWFAYGVAMLAGGLKPAERRALTTVLRRVVVRSGRAT
jgi:O-antigen/teichoic acid export membrane protein